MKKTPWSLAFVLLLPARLWADCTPITIIPTTLYTSGAYCLERPLSFAPAVGYAIAVVVGWIAGVVFFNLAPYSGFLGRTDWL